MDSPRVPTETLIERYANWKNVHSRRWTVVGSTYSWISILASSAIVWMMGRSRVGFSSTFHRLLLCVCASAVMVSLGGAHYNYLAPRDLDYVVWNAHGNALTCDVVGFVEVMGIYGHLLYICSLCVYSLIVVKFDKSDEFIKRRIEPWLLGVPGVLVVFPPIIYLLRGNFNDNLAGICYRPVYDPPHCTGCEEGQIREGFDIPCFRGSDGQAFETTIDLLYTFGSITVSFVCLGVIYVTLRQLERDLVRDGEADNDLMQVRRRFSRAVMVRAAAYSSEYLIFFAADLFLLYYGSLAPEDEPRRLWILYLVNMLVSFPGIFNFIIFMHPRVRYAKRSLNCNWCQAIFVALRLRGPPRHIILADAEAEFATSASPPAPSVGEDSCGFPDVGQENQSDKHEGFAEQCDASLPSPRQCDASVPSNGASTPVTSVGQNSDGDRVQREERSGVWEERAERPREGNASVSLSGEFDVQDEIVPIGPMECGVPLAQSVADHDQMENDSGRGMNNEGGAVGDVHIAAFSSRSEALRQVCLEEGIAIATLESWEKSEGGNDSDVAVLSRVSQRLSSIGLIHEEDHQIV